MSSYSADASLTITTTSCSDCRAEQIEKRWTRLLLSWMNNCVHPKTPVTQLNIESLIKAIHKYKDDINMDDIDTAELCDDDIEAFIELKYPLLRLKFLDDAKKLYVVSSVLLYHCCIGSKEGQVDSDICSHLHSTAQGRIVKFCETLSDMEVTCHNVEWAIRDACESVKQRKRKSYMKIPEKAPKSLSITSSLPSENTCKPSVSSLDKSLKKSIKFKSSVTLLPSSYKEIPSLSDIKANSGSEPDGEFNVVKSIKGIHPYNNFDSRLFCEASGKGDEQSTSVNKNSSTSSNHDSKKDNQESQMKVASSSREMRKRNRRSLLKKQKIIYILLAVALGSILLAVCAYVFIFIRLEKEPPDLDTRTQEVNVRKVKREDKRMYINSFICNNNLCEQAYEPITQEAFLSMSRCVLQCMGPQLWPHPIGETFYSNNIIAFATSKLEYKLRSVPSESVGLYLDEAFKLFNDDLAKLEKKNSKRKGEISMSDLLVRKLNIQIDVESDADPRMRVDTDESYHLELDIVNNDAVVTIVSPSFCGARHGLETLSQLILYDDASRNLITLEQFTIKDAPSYRYRGLMIDTGRNYIPIPDLMRTVDAMATCKLNTFHWRISDATSFPLQLAALPQLYEYGAFDRKMVYTREDVLDIVKRASVRGIRVLIEVAVPGPLGRAWAWSPDVSCPIKNINDSCSNILCSRMIMKDTLLDVLQKIYTEIIDMTFVDDIFHLSDSVVSMVNCYYLMEDRVGFLEKALERLKLANKGFLPKLPIIWYTTQLDRGSTRVAWNRYGVQLAEWQPNAPEWFLSKFRVIYSAKWDLSCEIDKLRCTKYRSWQEMYAWKLWKSIEVLTIEGGESVLWTDLVDSGNLDYHLWPRAAAVAERLWSDMSINESVTSSVYIRLDSHRSRMQQKSIMVEPIWPVYCTFNPGKCIQQLYSKKYT